MRFVQQAAVLLSTVLPFVSAAVCDSYTADTQCKSVTVAANVAGTLSLPTTLFPTATSIELPPFVNKDPCVLDAEVEAHIGSGAQSGMLVISIYNPSCVEPKANTMTKIHAANFIANFYPAVTDHPCVARYDAATGESTCLQHCSDSSSYVCYLGANAVLNVRANPSADEQTCNNNFANVPAAEDIPPQPAIQGLAFSSTEDANELDLTIRAQHYVGRVPPVITVGSACMPKTGKSWDPTLSVVSTVCKDDWKATYDWADLHKATCYSGTPSVTTIGSDSFRKFDYIATIVEQDELYLRPLEAVNLAAYRTTTTSQKFSIFAKQTDSDTFTFEAFDYSNVVSLVTSVSMSVNGATGTVVVSVYSTVQDPFIFKSGTNDWIALDQDSALNWEATFDESAGTADDGGDMDLLMQFTLATESAGCALDAGSFEFTQRVECKGGVDPSACPIPGDGYEDIVVTVNVPAIDLCVESESTDLTASLHVYGSSSYENRQAFFTEDRAEDYVYVLAVLDSQQIAIPNCDISIASAQMEGAGSLDLKTTTAAHWTQVYKDKTTSLPTDLEVGFPVPTGACLVMYKFSPAEAVFAVPYDSSANVELTMTINVDIPTSKRSVQAAVASTSITFSNPKSQSDDPESSDASALVGSAMVAVAGCVAALLF